MVAEKVKASEQNSGIAALSQTINDLLALSGKEKRGNKSADFLFFQRKTG